MAAKIKCFLPRTVPLFVLIIFLLTIRMIQAGIEGPPQPEEKVAEPAVEATAVEAQPVPVAAAPAPVEAPQAPAATPASAETVAASQPVAVEPAPAIVATPPEAPPAEALAPTDQPAPAVANEEAVAKSGSETEVKEKDVKSVAVETAPPADAAATAPPPAPSAPAVEYQGVYKSGNAPLKEKTKVRIFRSGDAYFFAHREESGSWSVQLESTRGAQATEKGIWFYWFDATDNTLNAYFEVSQNPQQLVSEINAAVTEFNNKMSDTAYKQRYEEYKQKALQEAK